MTKLTIKAIDKDILVPDVLWTTPMFGLLCGLGGLIGGFVIGLISDLVSVWCRNF